MSLGRSLGQSIGKSLGSSLGGEGASLAMPSDALGIWWMDEYQSSPRPYVPNSVDSTAVATGLMTAPRRRFASGVFWNANDLTVTDANANDQNGLANQASTIVSSGLNWYVTGNQANLQVLAAGTYTMAVNVRWKGTGTTDFKMGLNGGLVTKTASASWARFSTTFAHAGGTCFPLWLYTPDGTSAANFEICDADIFLSASDPGAESIASHIYLGAYPGHNKPTYASGVLDLSTGCAGSIQFPTTQTLTAGTALFVWKRTGNGFNAAYQPIIAFKDSGWSNFAIGGTVDSTIGLHLNGSPISKAQQSALLYDPADSTWAVGCHAWDATNSESWINDVKLLHTTGTFASRAIADLDFGFLQALYYAGYSVSSVALYDRKLTAEEVATAVEVMKARAAVSGITADPQTFAIFVGDSITYGSNGTPGYAFKFVANANPDVRGANWGVGGQLVSGGIAQAATIDAILPADKAGREFRLHTAWGANDLGDANPTGFTDALEGYLDDRRAAGWDKLTAATVISRTDGSAGFDAQHLADRTVANPVIVAWEGTVIDGVVDFAANADLGGAAAGDNATYFADRVHPTDTGHALMETIATPVFNGL